jgi:hypothetical protein
MRRRGEEEAWHLGEKDDSRARRKSETDVIEDGLSKKVERRKREERRR